MFGIGLPEMIVILAVALIVVGPDKLPELARSLAKGIGELKKTMNQVKENLSEETKAIESVQNDLKKTASQLQEDLLNDQTKTWPSGENTAVTGENDGQDIIDMEALEERPWEQDAQAEPRPEIEGDTDIPEQQVEDGTTPGSGEKSTGNAPVATGGTEDSKPPTAAA